MKPLVHVPDHRTGVWEACTVPWERGTAGYIFSLTPEEMTKKLRSQEGPSSRSKRSSTLCLSCSSTCSFPVYPSFRGRLHCLTENTRCIIPFEKANIGLNNFSILLSTSGVHVIPLCCCACRHHQGQEANRACLQQRGNGWGRQKGDIVGHKQY